MVELVVEELTETELAGIHGGRLSPCVLYGGFIMFAALSQQWWAVAGGVAGAYSNGCFA